MNVLLPFSILLLWYPRATTRSTVTASTCSMRYRVCWSLTTSCTRVRTAWWDPWTIRDNGTESSRNSWRRWSGLTWEIRKASFRIAVLERNELSEQFYNTCCLYLQIIFTLHRKINLNVDICSCCYHIYVYIYMHLYWEQISCFFSVIKKLKHTRFR